MVLQQSTLASAHFQRCEKAYLPEWLGGVLASSSLQDLWSTWVLVDKLGDIVDLIVDDDPHARLSSLVIRNVLDRVCLRHLEITWCEKASGSVCWLWSNALGEMCGADVSRGRREWIDGTRTPR